MGLRSCWWGLLLWLCWPGVALADNAAVRVIALPTAPAAMAPAPASTAATTSGTRVWLRAPHRKVGWYALRLARDWHAASPPLLTVGSNTRARVTVYLPPDYRPRSDTVYEASLDPTFSHHAVVYRLPSDLRADQPIYLRMGDPGQTQPIRVAIRDQAGYRAVDLRHIRASTFFASVQVSMVLVILCFWIVLRDRMYLYFIAYVGTQALYDMSVSGELFALPGAAILTPLGYHTGQAMAALASAFSLWFILEFADLRRYTPRLATCIGVLRWPFLALAVVVWLPWLDPDAWLPNTVNVLLIVSAALVLVCSWLAWRRGSRQAGFFLLSWVPLLALVVMRVVQLVAGLPLPVWLEYGFPGSMAWAAVIITVGLADRTLQVRHERDQATRMAEFDPLTGILNRRAIMQRLHGAWRPGPAGLSPLALLFLDIDHFKQVNDSRGHAAGDTCLVAITEAIQAELGSADRVGRYGGEEFLVMLKGDSARGAIQVAERMVARAAGLKIGAADSPIRLTVSIGVAIRDITSASVEDLVERADAAQYRAKAEGRNRVVVHRGAPATLLGMRGH